MYEFVDIMRERHDLEFARLLNRLRLNEMTSLNIFIAYIR